MIFEPFPRFVLPTLAPPCFAGAKLPSMKVFLQIQIAFVVEGLGEDLENAPQHTRAHPLLKPPVARLIGGIPVREIGTTITCSGPLFDPLRTHLDILGESATLT